MKTNSKLPEPIFPLDQSSPTQARAFQTNKGRAENRAIRTAPTAGEEIGFPFAAQIARLTRQAGQRQEEQVALVTSASPETLSAAAWLELNRAGWGIESGLHQRLDISFNEDRCRVQNRNGLWVLSMFRRLANSLYMEWCLARPKPKNVTTTHFQSLMTENLRSRALRLVLNRRSTLKDLS